MNYFGALLLGGALTVLTIALSQRSIFSGESIVPYSMAALGIFLVASLILVERHVVQPLLASFLYTSRAFLVQHYPISGGRCLDNRVGSRAPHGSHRHGEKSLGERPPLGPTYGRYPGGGGGRRIHTALDGSESCVHYRPCVHWSGLVVHEWLGDPGGGNQANCTLGHGWVGIWAGNPSHWGAAASLVTASRMVGMALGLAALSAWGIERFYSLTAHATIGATQAETEAPLIEAGVTVFQDLFMIAGFLCLFAILPALLMRVEDVEEEEVLV